MIISHNPPSGTSISLLNGKRTKPRTSITPQQLEILKQAYICEQRPTKQTREDLMAKTGLDMKVSTLHNSKYSPVQLYIMHVWYCMMRNFLPGLFMQLAMVESTNS